MSDVKLVLYLYWNKNSEIVTNVVTNRNKTPLLYFIISYATPVAIIIRRNRWDLTDGQYN